MKSLFKSVSYAISLQTRSLSLCGMTASQSTQQTLIRLNALISKHTRSGQHRDALLVVHHLHVSLRPDHFTLASALTAAGHLADVAAGKQLHAHLFVAGFHNYLHVGNALISYYAKTGDIDSSHQVFDEMPFRDVFSWTPLVSAHAKFGDIKTAYTLFDEMPQRNSVGWNALITGCVQRGQSQAAFHVFERMWSSHVACDHYTLASLLSLCCSPEFIYLGRQLHSIAILIGISVRVSVVNALLTMYLGCGMLHDACNLFAESREIRDQVTFNAMIAGLVGLSMHSEAFVVFKEMQNAWFRPTEVTIVSLFSACSFLSLVEFGTQIHGQVVKMGLENHVIVCNAAINMYSNCLDLKSSRLLFEMLNDRDLVSWNSMIAGYSQQHFCKEAMLVFIDMQSCGIKPDEFTYGSLFSGFSQFQSQINTEMMHGLAYKDGLILNTQLCNALMSAYARHDATEECFKLFNDMPEQNLISWNVIISACVQKGLVIEASDCFSCLQKSGFHPSSYTLGLILSTCGSVSSLRHGQELHAYILRRGLQGETPLNNALISMYGKCGCLNRSINVFKGMHQRDVVSWNAMIAAYAQHGEGQEALCCFQMMGESGIEHDRVTFTCILSACSHAGLIVDGCRIFSWMINDYGLMPSLDHYSCIIDLLGRAGNLDEAKKLVNSIPFEAGSYIWWALLSACRAHGDVQLGEIAGGHLLKSEPENPAAYVLLSNIHASTGQWEDAARIRDFMRETGVVKEPGCSWIESHPLVLASMQRQKPLQLHRPLP